MVEKPSIRMRYLIVVMLLAGSMVAASCSIGGNFFSPSPTAAPTQQPTDTDVALPDLVIQSVSIYSESGNVCPSPDQEYKVRIRVRNQGNSRSGPFFVQLNLDQQLVNTQLLPGQSVDLIFPELLPNSRAIVDVTSMVVERDESNNQVFQRLGLPTPIPECIATATPIIKSLESTAVLEGHDAKVWDVKFSPDGRTIASGSVDDTLRLWAVEPPRLIRTIEGHPFPVLKVEFTPNGVELLTGSTDGALRIWQVSTGRLLKTLEGHVDWITGLDIAKDGKWLASSAEDATVRLWRMPAGSPVQIIDEGMAGANSVTFTPDAYAVAWGETSGIVRIRTISGVWLQTWQASSQSITSLAFSPNGEILATGTEDGTIGIWSMKDNSQIQSLRGHAQLVSDLAFSPDGAWLVSASSDASLRLWSFTEGTFLAVPVVVFQGHTGPVTSVDFSPTQNLVVSGSDDGTIRLWQVPQE